MYTINELLEVLSVVARVVDDMADPEITKAYSRAATLIRNSLQKGTGPYARQAYELCVTRADDPMTWKDPIVEIALRDIPRTHINRISRATHVLAMRLPGEPGVDSGEDRSGSSEPESDEG